MKRIWFSVIMFLIGIIIINGCRRMPAPTAPAPTNTTVNTNTPVNIKTGTQTNTPFASATATISKTPARTVTMTNTCDCLTGTQTPTSTLTPAPQGYLTWNCAPVSTPIGIAVDNNNNGVYVTEIFCPSLGIVVQEYDFNGNTITQWGSIGSGNGQFSVSMYGGPGIAVDNTGAYIYIADSGNNRVQNLIQTAII